METHRLGEELGLVDRDAVDTDPLPRVPACPAQPDADHGKAEVVRRLDVVAREDAEAARVDGEVLVQAELHAEVGDGRRHRAGAAGDQRRGG